MLRSPLAANCSMRSKQNCRRAVRLLQDQAIAPVDMAQSAIGPGMEIFSRYAKVLEADGTQMRVRTALGLINEALEEALSSEETEFDADTRWALTWYEQFGHDQGQFGDAETLAKAKNTSVEGVVRAGVAESQAGKVRLAAREKPLDEWDPATDSRLTVWKVAQQMVARLEDSGETHAADLLQNVWGGGGGWRSGPPSCLPALPDCRPQGLVRGRGSIQPAGPDLARHRPPRRGRPWSGCADLRRNVDRWLSPTMSGWARR